MDFVNPALKTTIFFSELYEQRKKQMCAGYAPSKCG